MKEILYYTVCPKQKSLSKLFTTKGWPNKLKPYEADRYMFLCEDHSFNYITVWMSFKLWIQNIDSNHLKLWFYLWQKAGLWRQSLVCSMIMISKNATLRRTHSTQKWFLIMIVISKNVRILLSVNFSQCDMEHKHDQCECDSITDEK